MNKKIGLIAVILFLAGVAIYVLSMVLLPIEDMLVLPEGYEKICSINLSEKHENNEIYKMQVSEASKVGFYIWSNSADDKTNLSSLIII